MHVVIEKYRLVP